MCGCVLTTHDYITDVQNRLGNTAEATRVTTEPRGLTATQSRPADLFTTTAAAARGDAAQVAFDRKLSYYRNEIPDLRSRHSNKAVCSCSMRTDCSEMFHVARIARLDILWSVHTFIQDRTEKVFNS